MIEADPDHMLEKLHQLRAELVELAAMLECRGRLDAADAAMTTSAHVAELCEDIDSMAEAL